MLRFYLEKRLPDGVLPARRVQEIFEALEDEQRLSSLMEDLGGEVLEHALMRLLDFEDDFTADAAQSAVPVLMNQSSKLPEGRRGFLAPMAEDRLRAVVRRLLEKVEDGEARIGWLG